jgi:hypothetical protein
MYCLFILSFCVLFVCKCVLYNCHRVATQLKLTDISYFYTQYFRLKEFYICDDFLCCLHHRISLRWSGLPGISEQPSHISRGGAVGWGTALLARKVTGLIPDGVTGIFHWHNHSGRTTTLGVDSRSNRNKYQEYFVGGKGGRCVGLTTLLHSYPNTLEIWEPQPPGNLKACPGL